MVVSVATGRKVTTAQVSELGRPSSRMHSGCEHWRNYYDEETLSRGDALREVHAIRSAGETIHIDAYPRPEGRLFDRGSDAEHRRRSEMGQVHFGGTTFLAGGSVGGGLSYYAAAAGAPARAIACLNLVDFSTTDSWQFSKLAPWAKVAGMATVSERFMRVITPMHRVRFPFSWIGRSVEGVVDAGELVVAGRVLRLATGAASA